MGVSLPNTNQVFNPDRESDWQTKQVVFCLFDSQKRFGLIDLTLRDAIGVSRTSQSTNKAVSQLIHMIVINGFVTRNVDFPRLIIALFALINMNK